MTWFTSWWQSMTFLQQAFACVAIPATLLLIVQMILMMIGIGTHGGDAGAVSGDFNGDGVPDSLETDTGGDIHTDVGGDVHDGATHGAGLRIFTVQGIVAFFAVGGWLGIVLQDSGASDGVSILSALAGGLVALLAVAFIIRWSMAMQENGTLSMSNTIARTGTVYLKIPPRRTGTGKVNLTVQEQFVELEAMTDADQPIPVGAGVQVVGLVGENTLLVRSLSMASKNEENQTRPE